MKSLLALGSCRKAQLQALQIDQQSSCSILKFLISLYTDDSLSKWPKLQKLTANNIENKTHFLTDCLIMSELLHLILLVVCHFFTRLAGTCMYVSLPLEDTLCHFFRGFSTMILLLWHSRSRTKFLQSLHWTSLK